MKKGDKFIFFDIDKIKKVGYDVIMLVIVNNIFDFG